MIEIHDGWMLLFIYSDIILISITLAYVRKIRGGRRMKNLFKNIVSNYCDPVVWNVICDRLQCESGGDGC